MPCTRYPKSVSRDNHRLLDFAIINSQIEKYRTRRLELGQDERKATYDTIVYLSLLGPRAFHMGIGILQRRGFLDRRAEIYVAGPLYVGVGFYGISPGEIIGMSVDEMYLHREKCMLSTECVEDCTDELVNIRLREFIPSFVEKIAKDEMLYCALCFERPEDDKVLEMPFCEHWFCRPCITTWVGKVENDRCPICSGFYC